MMDLLNELLNQIEFKVQRTVDESLRKFTRDLKQIDSDEILNVKQAADFLNLSVSSMYGLVQRKSIPVSKRGKRLYFSKQDLLTWLKEGNRKIRHDQ